MFWISLSYKLMLEFSYIIKETATNTFSSTVDFFFLPFLAAFFASYFFSSSL
jgi:hypothetical protein